MALSLRRLTLGFLIIAFFCAFGLAASQKIAPPDQFLIKKWTTEEGLPAKYGDLDSADQ